MAKRWQYQVKAQPTDTRSPGQVDQWMAKTPDIYFPKPVLSPAIQSGSFFVGEGIPPTDKIKPSVVFPDYFPKPYLSRAIQSGSFTVGEIWKLVVDPNEVLNVHYPGYPNYFPKLYLSRAIQSGSFFIGEIWKADKDVHCPIFLDYHFVKPSLSKAILSGSFFIGEVTVTIPPIITFRPWYYNYYIVQGEK